MAALSNISWTDHTWNGWIGCSPISPGCKNCYAERWARRYGRDFHIRTRTKTWGAMKKWNDEHDAFFAVHSRRQRVFCFSLADCFDNQVEIEVFVDFLGVCKDTPNLDKLLLTKRIGNVLRRLQEAADHLEHIAGQAAAELRAWILAWLDGRPPLDVWLGCTVVNQEEADRDIPKLLKVPAILHFLSLEPLLERVVLRPEWLERSWPYCDAGFARGRPSMDADYCGRCGGHRTDPIHVDPERVVGWVIVGGESTKEGRPMNPSWARQLRAQCEEVGVPFHFKQWGQHAPREDGRPAPGESPAVLHFVEEHGMTYASIGAEKAGRELDGQVLAAFPRVDHLVPALTGEADKLEPTCA